MFAAYKMGRTESQGDEVTWDARRSGVDMYDEKLIGVVSYFQQIISPTEMSHLICST